jgi:hypothetical protein
VLFRRTASRTRRYAHDPASCTFDTYKNDVDALITAFYDRHARRALGAPKIRDFLEFAEGTMCVSL